MGKLNQINGYVQITPDKLQPIRADLLRLDTSWQEWSFAQLVQALREWTIRNPLINQESRRDQPSRKGRLLQINIDKSVPTVTLTITVAAVIK